MQGGDSYLPRPRSISKALAALGAIAIAKPGLSPGHLKDKWGFVQVVMKAEPRGVHKWQPMADQR
jgi:hypothetical protein